MLKRIIDVINASEINVEGGTLFCKNYIIADIECLEYLENENLLEEPLSSKVLGQVINIEISLAYINGIGFYEDFSSLVKKNRYAEPKAEYFIHSLQVDGNSDNQLLQNYRLILKLISSICLISKHIFEEVDVKCAIVSIEEKSIVIPLIYDNSSIGSVDAYIKEVSDTISVFDSNSFVDKKKLFISELVSFLFQVEEESRFSHLLLNFKDYYNKSINSYEFYLRDFSFNKLKIEIDTKSLEFNQKIQGVINDSQTKLIAIPTAFVLVYSTFDFDNVSSIKNAAILCGTFVFSILVQLFLNNQFSVLKFINVNMDAYKETFKNSNTTLFSEKFALTYIELGKQKQRLNIVEVLLWIIPLMLLVFWVIKLIIDCKSSTQANYLSMFNDYFIEPLVSNMLEVVRTNYPKLLNVC